MFALTSWTPAILATKTDRTEHHGEDKVPAVTLGFRITGPNTILDLFGAPYDFRYALYMQAGDDQQEQFDGIDSTPLLRTPGLGVIPMPGIKLEGWHLHIDHGIDEHEPIDLADCTVSKFKVTAFQGGSCELSFMVSTNDIDAEYGGLLLMKLGSEVPIKLLAPEKKPDAIDGSTEAFEADHPPLFMDAADTFADNEAAGLNKDASEVPKSKRGRSNRPSLAVQG